MPQRILFLVAFIFCNQGCDKDIDFQPGDLSHIPYDPEAITLDIPDHFPAMPVPEDNPMTKQGVELGRHLFYDPILSSDGSTSCSTCHLPEGSFTDNLAFSIGVDDQTGHRSSMSLLNVGFNTKGFFWDGRAMTLEEQALEPVENPIELHESWDNVEIKLRQEGKYQEMFRQAFGILNADEITRDLAVQAIAQFERTLISSGESKYDRVINGQEVFTDEELTGHNIFFDIEPDISRHAECGHCHNAPLFTTNEFFNNGLDNVPDLESFTDPGRGEITGQLLDNGTFRVPSLRNIFFTAPYMHDGRFETLDEVLDHYISGGHAAQNRAAVIRPLTLSDSDRQALIAFIKTLDDTTFLQNPEFHSPF